MDDEAHCETCDANKWVVDSGNAYNPPRPCPDCNADADAEKLGDWVD